MPTERTHRFHNPVLPCCFILHTGSSKGHLVQLFFLVAKKNIVYLSHDRVYLANEII
jgi:hypothetical protein